MKILFICNQNLHRSKTAELLFKDRFETRSAGLYNLDPVSEGGLAWADLILVMDAEQRKELSKRFPAFYMQKRILALDIPDTFQYGQKELIALLEEKMENLVKPLLE